MIEMGFEVVEMVTLKTTVFLDVITFRLTYIYIYVCVCVRVCVCVCVCVYRR
jgi:hypothetical protein